jgi:type I site-specific restriction endonuclease
LFLADRNILANQAFNSFSAFPEDALIRIKPSEIKKKGKVPTNGSIFFTIFQSFMTESIDNGELKMKSKIRLILLLSLRNRMEIIFNSQLSILN